MTSAFLIKEIKPDRFRDDRFRAEIEERATWVANEILKDFERTVETWEHKVKFEVEYDFKRDAVSVLVGTDDFIYMLVNRGARPHLIFPVKARALSFQWGGPGSYRAKTQPETIGSFDGGPTGDMVAFAYVEHPGHKARNLDKTIEEKWRTKFRREMERAMSDAADASGHAMV